MPSSQKKQTNLSLFDKTKNKIKILFAYLYANKNKDLFVSQKINENSLNNLSKNLNHDLHIKYNDTLLKTSSSLVIEKWGGRKPSFYGYESSVLDSCCNSIKFYNGTPLEESQTFHNVFYLPEYRCFYLSDGSRIDYSCRPENKRAPITIQIPSNVKKVNQKFIYGGHLFRHYGHFLTECICRLWYAAKEQSYPIIYSETPRISIKEDFVDIFMKATNLEKKRFFYFSEPIFIEEVIIPYPSIIFREKAYAVHRLLPEIVAKFILNEHRPNKIEQPLYLSRSKLNLNENNSTRDILNEEKLEEKLLKNNFKIIYPEQLSFEEQVCLINQHQVIIGVCGSALHNILFDLSDTHLVCLGDDYSIHPNFLLMDAIKSKNSTYIASLKVEQNSLVGKSKRNRTLDVEKTVSGLKAMGLL